jgi:hypothetical protein
MARHRRLLAIASRRVTRRHYAEELAWWAASGWALEVEDLADGRLLLHTIKDKARGGSVSWGATALPEEVASPALTRRFLTEALYLHLHPIKGRRQYELTGRVCTDEELAGFICGQRRKAKIGVT